jgi:hypothetical protein
MYETPQEILPPTLVAMAPQGSPTSRAGAISGAMSAASYSLE